MGRNKNDYKKIIKIMPMHNGMAMSYGSKLHMPPTKYHLLAAQQELYMH